MRIYQCASGAWAPVWMPTEIDFEEISDSKFRRYLEQCRGSQQVLNGFKWKEEEEGRYGHYVSYDDWRENSPEQRAKLFGPGRKLCMAMLITTVTLAIVVMIAAMLLAANTSAVVLISNIAQLMITNEYCHKSCTSKMSWMGNAGVAEMKWNEMDIDNI
jgi:hypothetical protein